MVAVVVAALQTVSKAHCLTVETPSKDDWEPALVTGAHKGDSA